MATRVVSPIPSTLHSSPSPQMNGMTLPSGDRDVYHSLSSPLHTQPIAFPSYTSTATNANANIGAHGDRRNSGISADAATGGIPVHDHDPAAAITTTTAAAAAVRRRGEPALVYRDGNAAFRECTTTAAIHGHDEPKHGADVAW
jgi:hypothetical protein